MKKYEHLLTKAEEEIVLEDEKKILESLKARLERKRTHNQSIADLDKEIDELLTDGKITSLDTTIKINAGSLTYGTNTGISLSVLN